jgi:hypothetical protein
MRHPYKILNYNKTHLHEWCDQNLDMNYDNRDPLVIDKEQWVGLREDLV